MRPGGAPSAGFRAAGRAASRPGGGLAGRRRGRRGLTLLEVLISISIIVVMLGILLTFYWQTMKVRTAAVDSADRTQIARQVLDRIAHELRGCVGFDQVRFPVEHRLLGDRRRLSFLTTALPSDSAYVFRNEFEDLPPARHDLTQVTYWLWVDPEDTQAGGEPLVGGIIRTEKQTLNQFIVEEEDPLQVRNDLWSYELGYLEFRYFDGVEWTTVWEASEGNSLPHMIMVTVGFQPITRGELDDTDLETQTENPFDEEENFTEHPDRYTAIIRVPAADRFYGARIERVGKQLAEQLGVEGVP